MTQKLNIDIVARDKTKQALNNVQGALAKVKGAVFNLQNAFTISPLSFLTWSFIISKSTRTVKS